MANSFGQGPPSGRRVVEMLYTILLQVAWSLWWEALCCHQLKQRKTERRAPGDPAQPALSHTQHHPCSARGRLHGRAPAPPTPAHFLWGYSHDWHGHFTCAPSRLPFPEPMSPDCTHHPLYYPKQLFRPTSEWTTWEAESWSLVHLGKPDSTLSQVLGCFPSSFPQALA